MRRLIYARKGRWWGDFRGFADVGGAREPLKGPNDVAASTNHKDAERYYDLRYAELAMDREKRRPSVQSGDPAALVGLDNRVTLHRLLEQFINFYETSVSPTVTVSRRRMAQVITAHLPPSMPVRDLRAMHVHLLLKQIRDDYVAPRIGRRLASRSRRQILQLLQQTLDHAMAAEVIDVNPARGRIPKNLMPPNEGRETAFYTVAEAGRILTALQRNPDGTRPADWPKNCPDYVFEQVAFALYTGARLNEVQAQQWQWIDWETGRVTLYTSKRKRGEQRGQISPAVMRTVPLWPQWREILLAYWRRCGEPASGLLFPLARRMPHRQKHPLPTIERGGKTTKALRTILRRRNILTGGENTPLLFDGRLGYRMSFQEFRVTYCATRLQTIEPVAGKRGQWVPVAQATVEREMGHASEDMVNRVYKRVAEGPQLRLQAVAYPTPKATRMLTLVNA